MKKLFFLFLNLIIVQCLAVPGNAQMQSNNYQITTSVMSGGGEPMASDNYETNATLGQPSPLMDPNDPPYSANHDLYPGFWYTLDAGMAGCEDLSSFAGAYGSIDPEPNYSILCDSYGDGDGDVDGSDLAEFAAGVE